VEVKVNDKVIGVSLSFPCRVGVADYEREIVQPLLVDFEVETDWRQAALHDDPSLIVDYLAISRGIAGLLKGRSYKLIEAVAEDVARLICTEFPVMRVRVRVTKTPFDMPNAAAVAVECQRRPEDFAERG